MRTFLPLACVNSKVPIVFTVSRLVKSVSCSYVASMATSTRVTKPWQAPHWLMFAVRLSSCRFA